MAQGAGRVTITIRTSKELQRWLKAQAKKNNRSLNQEVEYRLMRGREGEEAKPLLEELRSLVEAGRRK
jgi:HicB family